MLTTDNTKIKKILLTFVGIFFLFILIFNFLIGIKQPYINLGFTINLSNTHFSVTQLQKNTPAYKAGINEDTHYKAINNISIFDLVNDYQTLGEAQFKIKVSNLFEYGKTITFTDFNDNNYTFKVEPLSFFNSIIATPLFVKLRFCISFIMLLSGIALILFTFNERTSASLIISVFFLSLSISTLFENEFSTLNYLRLSSFILYFGLLFTLSSIFQYFSFIYKKIYKNKIFSYLSLFPILLFVFYIFNLCFSNWTILNNQMQNIISIFAIISLLTYIAVFIHLSISSPKNIPVVFKFFILALSFAAVPLLIQHFVFILQNQVFMSQIDKIYSVLAFALLPFLLFLSIFHNKNVMRSKNVYWVTSYLAFFIILIPIVIITLQNTVNQDQLKVVYCLICFAPILFYLLHFLINKFFATNKGEHKRKLSEYKQLISTVTDTTLLHKVTSSFICDIINCSYIFFYKKTNDKWELMCECGHILKEERQLKFQKAFTKQHITFFKDGSFSIPIIRNNSISGFCFIGPKLNSDIYLPGEHTFIEQIIKSFHHHYLIYTNEYLINAINNKNKAIIEMQNNTILSMANLIESRDGGTGAHVKRTAEYSLIIAEYAKEHNLFTNEINDTFIDLIKKAAPMHDIGKIVVPDNILKKPGRFTQEEFEMMKLHTTEGEKIVKDVLSQSEDANYIKMTSEIAMNHHEKWDGTGYPKGLKGEEIPLSARILAIADVFDALVSPRCYKEPMETELAFSIIEKDAGTHFDPEISKIFLKLKKEAIKIKEKYL